jgi:hypothetical protein
MFIVMKFFSRTTHVCEVYPPLMSRWLNILTKISRHTTVSYLGRMIYQYSVRMRGNWLDYTWTLVFFCSQIVIKLNIKFDRHSISLRELRSYFDHVLEADDHQGLDRYTISFALELVRSIMFPDDSGDSVPAFLRPILMVRVLK